MKFSFNLFTPFMGYGFFDKFIDDLLLINNFILTSCLWFNSINNLSSNATWQANITLTMYFALYVDNTITSSFLELHEIGAPSTKNTKPVVLIRSSLTPSQFSFVNSTTSIFSIYGMLYENRIPFVMVHLIYLRIRLSVRIWDILGLFIDLDITHVKNSISSCVWRRYHKESTIFLYAVSSTC